MSPSIDDYRVEYFLPTVRAVLDPLLAEQGFRWIGDYREVSAYWGSGRRFLSFGYLPETSPDYELLLGVGESDESPLEPTTSETTVGVWRLLPEEEVERIASWSFDSPEALERELRRAWREAVMPYVFPVLEQGDRLAEIIAAHEDEFTEEDLAYEREQVLGHARAAFDMGRYDDALEAYGQVDEAAHKASDRKRIEIARRRR